jgi:peptide/nickel transport system substrate-binding protein
MRKLILPILLLSGLFYTSCSGDGTDTSSIVAKGGKKYGGTFRFMSAEKIASVFPIHSGDLYSSRIVTQIFEPLMRIDPTTLDAVPCIAESFTVNVDATVYTFTIRKGVKFHENDCFANGTRELKAEDVKFSLDLACSGLSDNEVSYLLVEKIKGGSAFNEKSKKSLPKEGVSGIKVINDHKLEITLEEPFSGFESIMTHVGLGISPKEAYDKYGSKVGQHPVGTGPFQFESMTDAKIVLKRNPNYWDKDEFGNQLPFLDKIELTYAENKRSELMAFRKQNIDLVLELPVEEIDHILGTLKEAQEGKNVLHKVESEQSMSMMYVAMACESDEFKDERVRKAFNLAVDRVKIVDNTLQGEGWPALNGFVPSIGTYPSEKVKGFVYNPEAAKTLMSSAGYPNGKGFPTLDFYVNTVEGSGMHKTCVAIADQLKENLGVNLKVKLCTIEERRAAIASGKAKIWREGWIADYPNPENFLTLFYAGNINDNSTMVNTFKFKSPEFDELFKKALRETNDEARTALWVKCDQMIIDKAAVMPILTDDHIVMVNARIKGFEANPLESIFLRDVYIKEPKKETEKED